jgi:hypothetical protein
MSDLDQEAPAGDAVNGVTEDDILQDRRSQYANVLCPVHGVAPAFERDAEGGLVEAFCCEALAQIFRELRAAEGKAQDG